MPHRRLAACAIFVATPVQLLGCGGAEGSATSTRDPHLLGPETIVRTAHSPQNRLIVLDHSVGGIRLGEPRRDVEKAFGRGRSSRGLVWYFGGRLLVDYWFHDELTTRVEGVETRWGGFHTRSGVRVGSSRARLSALHVSCSDGECSRAAERRPDAPGTVFTIRHGKVTQINIFYG